MNICGGQAKWLTLCYCILEAKHKGRHKCGGCGKTFTEIFEFE